MLEIVKSNAKQKDKNNSKFRSRTVVLGDLLHMKEYDSFDTLRRSANRALSRMREDWLRDTLSAHGVNHVKRGLTKREIQDNLSSSAIRIERDTEKGKDIDRVYKDHVLIGEWNNKRKVKIDFDGRLSVTIEYYIRPST